MKLFIHNQTELIEYLHKLLETDFDVISYINNCFVLNYNNSPLILTIEEIGNEF